MIDIFAAAVGLQAFCDRQGWRSCFIGGIAVQRWGEPRVTRDVDLTLLTGFGDEAEFVDPLLGEYSGRIPDAREFAIRHRVLLLRSEDGVGIDISLAALPFEERIVENATSFIFGPDLEVRTCSAEDLVVMKLFAARAIDLRDATGVVARERDRLNWTYVEEQLAPLAEAKPGVNIMRELSRLREL